MQALDGRKAQILHHTVGHVIVDQIHDIGCKRRNGGGDHNAQKRSADHVEIDCSFGNNAVNGRAE